MKEISRAEIAYRKIWFNLIYLIWMPFGMVPTYLLMWKKDYKEFTENLSKGIIKTK